MSFFSYQGKQIYYEECGTGSPLVLLHGNTASSRMFASFTPLYAQQHKVILLDFLGCGQSERVQSLAQDLWYDEALQLISLLDTKAYQNVDLIGVSGGAMVALNVALERPDLVRKIIADSFEGERALPDFTKNLRAQREASKSDPGTRMFYEMMNGADWEKVVDADTRAIVSHAEHIGNFFHKPLSELKADVLLTGSDEDEFGSPGFFESVYRGMLKQIGHGQMHIFNHGGHPAMLSNQQEYFRLSQDFLDDIRKLKEPLCL